ncbi:DNA processing protein [Vibrio cholerae]|nr:DNA processing protein [Vibrio cholerae]
MKDQDLAAWLALCFTPKLGSKTISHLLATRLPAQLQSFTPKQWLACGLKPEQLVFLTTQAAKQAEQCLQWRSAANNRYIVTPHCPLYPRLLKEINSSPPTLRWLSSVAAMPVLMGGRSLASLPLSSRSQV